MNSKKSLQPATQLKSDQINEPKSDAVVHATEISGYCFTSKCEFKHAGQKVKDVKMFCAAHCREPNHGHCTSCHMKCSSTDICEESSLCKTHCKHINHSHCISPSCGETTLCDLEAFLCAVHCSGSKHGHCSEKHCATKPICKSNIRCIFHCTSSSHDHCNEFHCEILKKPNSVCKSCEFHCENPDHSHCSERLCDKPKNSDLGCNFCKYHGRLCVEINHGHCSQLFCYSEVFYPPAELNFVNEKYECPLHSGYHEFIKLRL